MSIPKRRVKRAARRLGLRWPEVVLDAPRHEETALGIWEVEQARFERLVSHCPPDLWEGSEVVPAPLPPLPLRLVVWRALYVLARPTQHVREAWRVSGWLVLSRITD